MLAKQAAEARARSKAYDQALDERNAREDAGRPELETFKRTPDAFAAPRRPSAPG
jgi:hypothetical protein